MSHQSPWVRGLFVALGGLCATPALGITFDWPGLAGERIEGTLNTTLTLGAAWRVEDRAPDLISKGSQNPLMCSREDGRLRWQACQGLFRDQTWTADRLNSFPGQHSSNADDGNWNYDKGDMVQAPFKALIDLTLSMGEWSFFTRGLGFYDFINEDFVEFHPNMITSDNLYEVANVSLPGTEVLDPAGVVSLLELLPAGFVPSGLIPVGISRVDSRECLPEQNPNNAQCGLVFDHGAPVYKQRDDEETLRQIGADLELMDFFVAGYLPLPGDRELTLKLGRQSVSWGESTLLYFDSINQANPVNANHLFRVGFQLEELFRPLTMVYGSTFLTDSLTVESFYQLEWRPVEAPAPGSFYSFADLGTDNAGPDVLTLGFGHLPDDPERLAFLLDNPLSGTTNTSAGFRRLEDREPDEQGQFGIALKYYAEWLNDGTEVGLYYMNYHSRLPFVSVNSVPEACGKNATDTASFTLACFDVPLYHALSAPNDPEGATDAAINFDAIEAFVEYPEDIQMLGISFNTTFGDLAVQGEVAYRPDAPMQVDLEDLAFAAYGPSATNCHLPEAGCSGSGILPNLAMFGDGSRTTPGTNQYAPSDFVIDAEGTAGGYTDTFDLFYGHAAGAGRYFPSFIVPYRGETLGLNAPESYIRGWEHFDSYQFNLGGTYLWGASDLPSRMILADQIIMLFETGATWVPDLPPLDILQLEAPGTFLHASAGADGSGADGSRQACSTNQACSFGPDGIRFNPQQQDLDMYPDEWSFGYDFVFLIRYESVLPGISLQPIIIWKHDVYGTSPGLAGNFVEGRQYGDINLEVRYKSKLTFNLGYNYLAGGGSANLLRDRDTARFFVRYQF